MLPPIPPGRRPNCRHRRWIECVSERSCTHPPGYDDAVGLLAHRISSCSLVDAVPVSLEYFRVDFQSVPSGSRKRAFGLFRPSPGSQEQLRAPRPGARDVQSSRSFVRLMRAPARSGRLPWRTRRRRTALRLSERLRLYVRVAVRILQRYLPVNGVTCSMNTTAAANTPVAAAWRAHLSQNSTGRCAASCRQQATARPRAESG